MEYVFSGNMQCNFRQTTGTRSSSDGDADMGK